MKWPAALLLLLCASCTSAGAREPMDDGVVEPAAAGIGAGIGGALGGPGGAAIGAVGTLVVKWMLEALGILPNIQPENADTAGGIPGIPFSSPTGGSNFMEIILIVGIIAAAIFWGPSIYAAFKRKQEEVKKAAADAVQDTIIADHAQQLRDVWASLDKKQDKTP
jgi:hypothetical protein